MYGVDCSTSRCYHTHFVTPPRCLNPYLGALMAGADWLSGLPRPANLQYMLQSTSRGCQTRVTSCAKIATKGGGKGGGSGGEYIHGWLAG